MGQRGARKGEVRNPKGRALGTPNKATRDARQAIAAFVDGNVDRLTGWLDRMAEDSPKDAFNAFMSVVEYHIPKLNRTTMEGTVTHKYEPLVIKQHDYIDVTPDG